MTIIKTNISGIFLIVNLSFRKARGHNLPLSTIFTKLINNCKTRKANPQKNVAANKLPLHKLGNAAIALTPYIEYYMTTFFQITLTIKRLSVIKHLHYLLTLFAYIILPCIVIDTDVLVTRALLLHDRAIITHRGLYYYTTKQ